ncbi:hypothetical protein [Micromonospora haikouensis]|uniref:hypothetical protein n=1 Tax=Micromonospora haikouensis TaxID=686309 RepID=UPI003D74D1FF
MTQVAADKTGTDRTADTPALTDRMTGWTLTIGGLVGGLVGALAAFVLAVEKIALLRDPASLCHRS